MIPTWLVSPIHRAHLVDSDGISLCGKYTPEPHDRRRASPQDERCRGCTMLSRPLAIENEYRVKRQSGRTVTPTPSVIAKQQLRDDIVALADKGTPTDVIAATVGKAKVQVKAILWYHRKKLGLRPQARGVTP